MASGVIKNVIDNRIRFQNGLDDDVLDVAKNMRNGILVTATSNNPTNHPPGCSWGSYLFIKSHYTTIFYADEEHIACVRGITSTTTSINWHVS